MNLQELVVGIALCTIFSLLSIAYFVSKRKQKKNAMIIFFLFFFIICSALLIVAGVSENFGFAYQKIGNTEWVTE